MSERCKVVKFLILAQASGKRPAIEVPDKEMISNAGMEPHEVGSGPAKPLSVSAGVLPGLFAALESNPNVPKTKSRRQRGCLM